MEIRPTPIKGLFEAHPKVFPDDRGWFMELFKEHPLGELTSPLKYVQDNLSFSKKGVLRGIHLQLHPFDQGKLVSVLYGKALDVVVDLRRDSETFGKTFSCILDDSRHNMLVIPPGFGHGFAALEDTHFYYKCTNVYNPAFETGIRWNDPALNIDWQIVNPILSAKDQALPLMDDLIRKSVISPN